MMKPAVRKRLMEMVWGPRPESPKEWRAVAKLKRVPKHGTLSRYNNQYCRCDECRAANISYQSGRRMVIQSLQRSANG
jgi:hypothetical protein